VAETTEERIEWLKKTIPIMESADPKSSKLKAYKDELAKLTKKAAPISSSSTIAEIPATEEEYESAGGSKFAAPGVHKSEFGMPYWKTPGMTIAFPFTIVEGEDAGKENEIFAGVGKSALWKLKEVLSALGVEVKKTKAGNIAFDFAEVAGKQAQTLWTKQVDTRPLDEGGTGSTYSKPVSVLPLGAEPPENLVS
jgi:hypothetical protein